MCTYGEWRCNPVETFAAHLALFGAKRFSHLTYSSLCMCMCVCVCYNNRNYCHLALLGIKLWQIAVEWQCAICVQKKRFVQYLRILVCVAILCGCTASMAAISYRSWLVFALVFVAATAVIVVGFTAVGEFLLFLLLLFFAVAIVVFILPYICTLYYAFSALCTHIYIYI